MKRLSFLLYLKGERGFVVLESLLSQGLLADYVFTESKDERIINKLSELGIGYQIVPTPNTNEHIENIIQLSPDLIICAGYSKMIPKSIIDLPRIGIINCHGGALPKYRGASPIPWQIINGETSGAAYILKLTTSVDDGEILASENYSIDLFDTSREVTNKVLNIFSKLVPDVLRTIMENDGLPTGIPQSNIGSIRWGKRYPEDGEIDWNRSVESIVNLVRALNDPYPGAFFRYKNSKIIVWKAKAWPDQYRGVPGRVLGKRSGKLLVACEDGAIALEQVEFNGNREPGDQLLFDYGTMLRDVQ